MRTSEQVASDLPPDLVFVDTETGGLDPNRHGVIEIAMIRVNARTLEEVGRFSSRVCSTAPVDPNAARVNGYDANEWRGAPVFVEILPDIVHMLRGARWVGSNPSFDLRFVDAELRAARGRVYYGPENTTYARARRVLSDLTEGFEPLLASRRLVDVSSMAEPLVRAGLLKKTGLDALGEFFGIAPRSGPHRAEDDARRTLEVYRELTRFFAPAVDAARECARR